MRVEEWIFGFAAGAILVFALLSNQSPLKADDLKACQNEVSSLKDTNTLYQKNVVLTRQVEDYNTGRVYMFYVGLVY